MLSRDILATTPLQHNRPLRFVQFQHYSHNRSGRVRHVIAKLLEDLALVLGIWCPGSFVASCLTKSNGAATCTQLEIGSDSAVTRKGCACRVDDKTGVAGDG